MIVLRKMELYINHPASIRLYQAVPRHFESFEDTLVIVITIVYIQPKWKPHNRRRKRNKRYLIIVHNVSLLCTIFLFQLRKLASEQLDAEIISKLT